MMSRIKIGHLPYRSLDMLAQDENVVRAYTHHAGRR